VPNKPPPLTLQTRADLTTPSDALKEARRVPLMLIDANAHQARQSFDETALAELAASIAAHGVIEPIIVRPVGDRYQVIAGERRTRAARLAGLTEIPALVRDVSDQEAAYLTALENLQRADLDIEDEARQFAALLDLTGLSQRALAEQLGINHVYLSRRVKLLQRPDLVAAYRAGHIGLMDAVAAVDSPPGVSPRNSEPPEQTERATLDKREPTSRRGDNLVRVPWRDRPLVSFMDFVARVDVTTVPAEERLKTREQLAAARDWIARLEQQLED
jgi:ParB/RepB/Spo0J family partition protein